MVWAFNGRTIVAHGGFGGVAVSIPAFWVPRGLFAGFRLRAGLEKLRIGRLSRPKECSRQSRFTRHEFFHELLRVHHQLIVLGVEFFVFRC
jgi:hypothetical protein